MNITGKHIAQDSASTRRLDARPLDDAAIEEIARSLSAARVVGIGESTRFAWETFEVRDQLFRELVRQHGFRLLAVQDGVDVAARQDEFVNGGPGSAEDALDTAWRPWRTREMAAALEWVRAFNQEHAHDPVRIIGVKPLRANAADYDAVVEAVRVHAPDRLNQLTAHLDPIRTVHTVADEHVQRARGVHPGRPFAEHARDAAVLVESIAALPDDVRTRMESIVDFHENSVAGRGSYVGDDELWARSVIDAVERTGQRAVYWDGMAHTAASRAGYGVESATMSRATVGSALRTHFGSGYGSVAVGFHHGDLGVADVPAPAADFLDARLGEFDLPVLWVDFRAEDASGPAFEPAKLRVISGVYDPARDAAEHMLVAAPADAFDVLVHIREASPVNWLA
ncbi:erythromycin esterase family protein [Nocardia jejuensis]|uniref:erythromycin esterase family protein n=1 Tax=Nocardia jejuensis TaxID=328049 RepID=UPI000831565C|nr:erythromycin esterase family protein [Nocardia jejuensis]